MATSFDTNLRVRVVFASFLISIITVSVLGKSSELNQDQQKPTSASGQSKTTSDPGFTEYRGVSIGMAAAQVRQKLGKPKVKDKSQDLFVFSENESAQIFYDEKENVYAISIDFTGRNHSAPTARDVLNEDVAAREDGSVYRLKHYTDAGYWVSYNQSNGDPPQVTITMQKIPE